MKICKDCKKELEIDSFPKNKNKKDGRSPYCKQCCSKKTMKSRYRKKGIETPDREKRFNQKHNFPYKSNTEEYRRHQHLVKKYGITLDDYYKMSNDQNNQCLICNLSPKVLNVDHDHNTGKVRALLCTNCNAGIGYFQDDPQLLQKAIIYINRYKI